MQRRHFDTLVSAGALILVVVLAVLGFYLKGRYDFAQGTVHDQLVAQRISFPPRDALTAEERAHPDLVKYAGERVDNGHKAEVYANDYIATHLEALANGKTYSELSAESRSKPNDAKLAGQVQTAFRGETLRGLLLTTFGFWQFGQEALRAMIVCFVAAGLLLILSVLGFVHAARTRPEQTI